MTTPAIPTIDGALWTLVSGLSGVVTLAGSRVYTDSAPAGTARPYVVLYNVTTGIENTTARWDVNAVWRIECVAESPSDAATLAAAVWAGVHDAQLTISGWSNFKLKGERQNTITDLYSGRQVWRVIQSYRIRMSQS